MVVVSGVLVVSGAVVVFGVVVAFGSAGAVGPRPVPLPLLLVELCCGPELVDEVVGVVVVWLEEFCSVSPLEDEPCLGVATT